MAGRWGRTLGDGMPLFCPQIAPALPLPSTRKSRVPFRMALLDPGLVPQPGREPGGGGGGCGPWARKTQLALPAHSCVAGPLGPRACAPQYTLC